MPAASLVAMNLLGWHGTILRVDRATGAWFHATLWPLIAGADDLAVDIPEDGLNHPALLGETVIEPAMTPNCVHLRRDGRYLRAEPGRFAVSFPRDRTGPLETFLLVSPTVLAGLRAVLAAPSRIAETGAACQAVLADGFKLRVAGAEVPIALLARSSAGIMLRIGGETFTLEATQDAPPPPRFILPGAQIEPPLATTTAEFAEGKSKIMMVADGAELAFPPLTVCDADQVWMQRQNFWPDRPPWGAMSPRLEIGRARDAFVLMGPLEGLIFTAAGVLSQAGRLDNVPVLGVAPLSRHGNTVFIDADVLRAAPVLAGPHVMFCGGHLDNFFHWMIEGMVPLCAIASHLPPETALLMPATLAALPGSPRAAWLPDYDTLLTAWGLGDMRRSTVAAPVCRVEELYWPRDFNSYAMPASGFQAARRLALAQLPPLPAGPRRRIHIRRTGTRRLRNAAAVEAALARHGFTTHEMPPLSPRAQMALFHEADFVISPHGADLANMLFCAPGTKVIEYCPDVQFRPFFSQISDKLGFCHGVLPCPSSDGSFDGDLTVDVARLEALIAQMQARL
jgi:hypothetical protein